MDAGLIAEIKALMHDEFSHFLADVEFRVKQAYDVAARATGADSGTVYAEDLHIGRHLLTGYTITNNSPAAGSIAWSSLHIVYNGVDNTITNGNTANKYAWWDPAVSATVLQTGNTVPTLTGSAALIFVNNGGVATNAVDSTVAVAVGAGVVTAASIAAGAVGTAAIADSAITPAKTSFYTALSDAIAAAQSDADAAMALADGTISTYFQATAPWATGTTQPDNKTGDIWYDSDDGQGYRWSGPAGTPVNTWVLIKDTGITTALANAAAAQTTANSKIQTFYAANSATPTASATGDLWVVTDKGNLTRRWSGSAWVDLAVGTDAIAAGAVTGAKIASGTVAAANIATGAVGTTQLADSAVTGAKITAGTVGATQLADSAVTGAKIASGAVGASQIAAGAVGATKLSVFKHMLY